MVVDVKTDQKFTKSKFLEMTLGIACYTAPNFKILFTMTCLCNSINLDDHFMLSFRIIASIEVYELILTKFSNLDIKNFNFSQTLHI